MYKRRLTDRDSRNCKRFFRLLAASGMNYWRIVYYGSYLKFIGIKASKIVEGKRKLK
ncbi:MAG: hypothetical protein LBP59_12750 [Planctomycetaceae bacterium]|nr:hypothetical protein [Planctomycetaceae bacterium]